MKRINKANGYWVSKEKFTQLKNAGQLKVGSIYHIKGEPTISNPNLLINGDFRVNQRGQTSYNLTSSKYCVDRWLGFNGLTVTPDNNGIRISATANGWFSQIIEYNYSKFANKPLTLSCSVDGVVYSVSGNMPANEPTVQTNILAKTITPNLALRFVWMSSKLYYNIYVVSGVNIHIEWCKLEIGAVATPFNPKPYAEELENCQRYYQKISYSAIPTFYNGASSSLYCQSLPTNLRTSPTLVSYQTANIRHAYNGATLTTASLAVTYYGDSVIRFSATHNENITPQLTVLFIQGVQLDAEIY